MTPTEPPRGRPRLVVVLLVLALVIVAVDQVTKLYAVERLTPGVIVPLVGDYLGWQLIFNPGAAFSLATGMTWVLTIVAVVVVVVVLRVARRLRSRAWAVALGLLLGGAVGNLVDRLVREPGFAQGHVVDFINYNGWFVGNVADIAIVLAAVLIAVLALLGLEIDGRRSSTAKDTGADAAEREDAPGRGPDENDESPLSEEPLDDDDEFTPLAPVPVEGEVDLARWVTSGDPAPERATPPADLAPEVTPASPQQATGVAEPRTAPDAPAPAAGVLAPRGPGRPGQRRWRSRREMRATTEAGSADDG